MALRGPRLPAAEFPPGLCCSLRVSTAETSGSRLVSVFLYRDVYLFICIAFFIVNMLCHVISDCCVYRFI